MKQKIGPSVGCGHACVPMECMRVGVAGCLAITPTLAGANRQVNIEANRHIDVDVGVYM